MMVTEVHLSSSLLSIVFVVIIYDRVFCLLCSSCLIVVVDGMGKFISSFLAKRIFLSIRTSSNDR